MKKTLFTFLLNCFVLFGEPIIDVQPVSGGASNQNYRVQVENHELFVRIGESANEEYQNASKAHSVGLTPEILYFNPALNMVIIPFIKNESRKLDFDVVDKVRELHQSGIVFHRVFCPFEAILENQEFAPKEILEMVNKLKNELHLRQDVPCHLDLHMGNFLFQEERIWMIDWEFAAMGDPLFDLAVFASTEWLNQELARKLLERYLQREVTAEEWSHFVKLRYLADVRWALWSLKKAKTSALDWDYKGDAERYMKSCYDSFYSL